MCFPDSFWAEYTKVAETGNIQRMMAFYEKNLAPAVPKLFLVSLVQFLLSAGLVNVALTLMKGETEKVSLKYLSLPFSTYLKVTELFCVMMLMYIVSALLYFLPFIYFGIRMLFVLPLLLEEPTCKFGTALAKSWVMTKGNFFMLLAFCIVCVLFTIVGVFALFIGVFFTTVICLYAYIDLYLKCKPVNQEQ